MRDGQRVRTRRRRRRRTVPRSTVAEVLRVLARSLDQRAANHKASWSQHIWAALVVDVGLVVAGLLFRWTQ